MSHSEYDRVMEAAAFVKARIPFTPKAGIITGTGYTAWTESLNQGVEIQIADVPNLIAPRVVSHRSRLIFTVINGVETAILTGRIHYYEGYEMNEVVRGVRMLHTIGCTHLITTNAAGGLNPDFQNGEIVLLSDHINLMHANPLRGVNEDRWGPRFPDMSNAYDKDWIRFTSEKALTMDLRLKTGVYAGSTGPNLETPAEYAFLRGAGADLVGMSAVPETIAARHLGMKVMAVSVVSNMCYPPENVKEVSVEEVVRVVNNSALKVGKLIEAALPFCMPS